MCASAGTGRQARLRGVCCMTYGFKSRLAHHLNRGRNLEFKSETSEFRPLFLYCGPCVLADFEGLLLWTKMGHRKIKIRKLPCKNKDRILPNPEFSF